jgi:CMP-N-acetylneuraminic acid synthetase
MIKIFVPIKLNSQRLPNKMLLTLGDKLLCQHIFFTLLEVKKQIDCEIYCFCSNENIKKYLPKGIIFLKRDVSLDKNETKGIDIYKSFIEKVNDGEYYVLCHATSPFIKKESIIEGINSMLKKGHDSALSVSKVQTFCWYQNKPLNYDLENIVRTQEIEPVFWETSAFFMFKKNILINKNKRIGNNPYFVETDRIESIDIDELQDFELAEKIRNNSN